MFDIIKRFFGMPQYISKTDTHGDDPEPDPNNLWIFTDPDAKDDYIREGTIKKLEHDIRFEVMRGEPWLPIEIEYKNEIRRLLRYGVIRDKGTYWYTSPHPTVYVANRSGEINVCGITTQFRKGDEIVFQCRMRRDMNNLSVPFIIGRFKPTDESMLCGDMDTAMKGMGGMGGMKKM